MTADNLTHPSRTALRFGPYEPPAVDVGDWIADEIYGLVQVGGWTEGGRISWPYRKSAGYRTPILCGALVEAVGKESAASIGYWWGVSDSTVAKWRRTLGVNGRNNPGSQLSYKAAFAATAPLRLIALERARQLALAPEVRTRIAATRRKRARH